MFVQMRRVVATYEQALDMVQHNGLILAHLTDYQTSLCIVEAAIRQNGLTLEFADIESQMSHGMALVAVKQNGLALDFAPPTMTCAPPLVV